MGVTSRIRWAVAPAVNSPTNFTVEFYADASGQAAFDWTLDLAIQGPSGFVSIKQFTGHVGGLGPNQRTNAYLQFTFPQAGNYYATTTSSFGTTIGKQSFKVTSPYCLIQKLPLNDYNWTTNELPSLKLTNFGQQGGTVNFGAITVHDGGVIQPDGSLVYARTRTIASGVASFYLTGGASKVVNGPALGLIQGYVEIDWPIHCPEDTINDDRAVVLVGKVN